CTCSLKPTRGFRSTSRKPNRAAEAGRVRAPAAVLVRQSGQRKRRAAPSGPPSLFLALRSRPWPLLQVRYSLAALRNSSALSVFSQEKAVAVWVLPAAST